MNVSEIVIALQNAKGPDRNLDKQIALQAGFKSAEEAPSEADTLATDRVVWRKPDGTPGRILAYTQSVDAAIELVGSIAPNSVGGCSWEKGRGSAKVGDGPYVHAANPAIALCAAALQLLWSRQNAENSSSGVSVR